MEPTDDMSPLEREFWRQIKLKEEARIYRASLPFPEKIRRLVRMQKRKAAILKTRGETWRVWDIPDGTESQPSHEESPATNEE